MVDTQTKEEVLKKLKKNRHILRQDFHVSRIGIFGSVARGEENEASDIDILVEFSAPIGLFRFMELERFLSGVLGKKVDLVTKNALKPIMREAVLHESVYA